MIGLMLFAFSAYNTQSGPVAWHWLLRLLISGSKLVRTGRCYSGCSECVVVGHEFEGRGGCRGGWPQTVRTAFTTAVQIGNDLRIEDEKIDQCFSSWSSSLRSSSSSIMESIKGGDDLFDGGFCISGMLAHLV